MSSNKHPAPWENHIHAWVCFGDFDRCSECFKVATFEEWLEAKREY